MLISTIVNGRLFDYKLYIVRVLSFPQISVGRVRVYTLGPRSSFRLSYYHHRVPLGIFFADKRNVNLN